MNDPMRLAMPVRRSMIESLPSEILLLFIDNLDFPTITSLLSVSTTFRSLSRRVLLELSSSTKIWYRAFKEDRFFDFHLDMEEHGGGRGLYMRSQWCILDTASPEGAEWNCPCNKCMACDVPANTTVHRLLDEVVMLEPWESVSDARFIIKDWSFVRFLGENGEERLMKESLFDPPVTSEVPIRFTIKFYYPAVGRAGTVSPWGSYDENWMYPYEVREAGLKITPDNEAGHISVGSFCGALEAYTRTMWQWEEKLEITGVNINLNPWPKHMLDVTVSTRTTYTDEEFFDHEVQEYNVPYDLLAYEPSEDPEVYSDSEWGNEVDEEVDRELEFLKEEEGSWSVEKVAQMRREMFGPGEVNAEEFGLKLNMSTQRSRGL